MPDSHEVKRQVLEQEQIKHPQQDVTAKEGHCGYKRASCKVRGDLAGEDERHGEDGCAGETVDKAGLFADKRIQISHNYMYLYWSMIRLGDSYSVQSYLGWTVV